MYIADMNWSYVDRDDTLEDCNNSHAHTFICAELNATFIPHHFSFAELNITNHAGPDSNFTYVANKRGMPGAFISPPVRSPMAARVVTRIEARNKDDNITQNFREDFGGNLYYENNISVTQSVIIPTIRTLPTDPDAYLYGDEANASKIDNKRIGFGRTSGTETDDPGTRNIKWDEDTYPLEFNFKRKINETANPFDVNGSYFSISLVSDYTQNITSTGQDPLVKGSRIGDRNTSTCIAPPTGSCIESNAKNNATFYYARTIPSKSFYDSDIGASTVDTPILINIYCNPAYTTCTDWDINTTAAQTINYEWWLALKHVENSTRHDGKITLLVGTVTPSGTASVSSQNPVTVPPDPAEVRITSGGIDQDVDVTATSTNRPMTVNIELVQSIDASLPYSSTSPYTDSWLIYNEDLPEPPYPFYKVYFIGASEWAGHGDTGHVVDSNASIKKNRRLGW
jgi:hypothetical protein